MVFNKIKRALMGSDSDIGEEYLEIDLGKEEKQNKVLVKLFTLRSYEEVTEVLNALREGYTIAIIDIHVLRKKDPIELKRAVSKIKKTTDALEGNIAGFGENMIIITPSFAKIDKQIEKIEERPKNKFE
jgi:SepF-like predicted cell division protein (DUF552 family)